MRTLIVGATGQIGTALTVALVRAGYQVTALVRQKNNVPNGVKIVLAEEFNREVFRNALRDIDYVIYCAGIPEQFVFDDTIFRKTNYDLLKVFIEEFIRSNKNKLEYISTYEVFQDINGIISEDHPTADRESMSPYYKSMIDAFIMLTDISRNNGVQLTTIHPAAVYGGLNTGCGITNFINNIAYKRFWKVPFIFDGRFPVIHVHSLSDGIIRSLGKRGNFILSDEMVTLKTIAGVTKKHVDSYMPVSVPLTIVKGGTFLLEVWAKITGKVPILTRVQIDYITKGVTPKTDKAERELKWGKINVDEGVKRYIYEYCEKRT